MSLVPRWVICACLQLPDRVLTSQRPQNCPPAQAYFVNIPSKFIDAAPAGGAAAGAPRTMGMFLSYSANFAFHDGANPPGSGYHWSLQQMRFTLNITSS